MLSVIMYYLYVIGNRLQRLKRNDSPTLPSPYDVKSVIVITYMYIYKNVLPVVKHLNISGAS